jgi:hypothetical protein
VNYLAGSKLLTGSSNVFATGPLLRRLLNRGIFREWKHARVDYVVNLESSELHAVRLGSIEGSHHLLAANLDQFLPIYDVGLRRISTMRDGSTIPVFDLSTGELLAEFTLNKCSHCFPPIKSIRARLAAADLN